MVGGWASYAFPCTVRVALEMGVSIVLIGAAAGAGECQFSEGMYAFLVV